MTHWGLFVLPDGPLINRQYITKEVAIVTIKNNLFYQLTSNKDKILIVPEESYIVPEEYIEIERCLLEIVEVMN